MQLIISARDQVLARHGNALAALGERQARTALSRALNHEGDKGRTQVKRALVTQTGIKYGAVDKAMATVRSTPATLTYMLKARGHETNIAWFGGAQRRKGVSAAPWNKRRIFARSFIVPRFGRAFSFIAGFDTRYVYNLWRPVTAIRAADTDGNDATAADPSWESS